MNREKPIVTPKLFRTGLAVGCLTLAAQAGTRYVPSEYSTIQAAISDSVDGDVVLVADGTYTGTGNRDMDFGGKAISVRSASGNPAACVIDCQGSVISPRRAFYFHTGEANASVVQGLTIRNGHRPTNLGYGGAVYCVGSSPLITDCIFENNRAGHGGAIATDTSAN